MAGTFYQEPRSSYTIRRHQRKMKTWDVLFQKDQEGLPWWHSGCESACRCRGRGFMPRSGKIPHGAEWLGP